MKPGRSLTIAFVLAAASMAAFAQQDGGRMKWEERQRLRQDLNSFKPPVRREPGPQEERERLREERMRRATQENRFSSEEREQLRRDILDANRDMRRRR